MTYPPQQPDDAARRAGLGEPVTGVPDMAEPAAPTPPPYGYPQPPTYQQPSMYQQSPTPSAMEPPKPPRPSRAPWAMVGALGGVAVLALVVALVVIRGGQEVDPGDVGGGKAADGCAPSEEPLSDQLEAGQFYQDKTWTNSQDNQDTAERLGRWDHADCCDVGLATSQETLNEAGCVYGIESAYKSADGHLGIGQLILAFGDSSAARDAANIDFTSFKLQPDSGVYDDSAEVYGYIESTGSFLVVTIGSIDTENQDIVDAEVQTLGSFHYDHLKTLPWQ